VYRFPDVLSPADGTVRIDGANAALLAPLLRPWLPDVAACQPMIALVVDARAVSVCCSVRRTDDAHDAGVETAAAFRGRGYARRVVAAWALAVRDLDRVPFYSTSWQNDASRGVARALGLVPFGSDLHLT
jgi:hypothetical protein